MSAANYQGADMGPISLSSPDQFNIDIFKTYFDSIKDQINGIRSVISANSGTIAETDNINKLYPVGFTADGTSLKRNTQVSIEGGTITASNFKGNVTGTATSVSKSLTFKSDGTGNTSNLTYNGSEAKSISYNSIGANPIVDPSLYSTVYTISTAAGTKAKTLAWTGYYLAPDRKFVINLSNNNTVAAATLNINSTGAKNIYIDANDDGSVVAVTASNLTKGYYRVSYDSANNRYVFVPISKIKETTSKYACGLMNSLSYNINGAQDTYNGYKPVNLPSIFAPTSAGTSNQVLISNGSGAPSWTDQSNIHAAAGSTFGTLKFYKSDGTSIGSFNGSSNLSINASSFFLTRMPTKNYSSYFTGPNDHREFYISIPKVSSSYFSWTFEVNSNDSFIKSQKCRGIYSYLSFTFQSMSGNTVTVNSDATFTSFYNAKDFEFSYDYGSTWHDCTGYANNSSTWDIYGEVMNGTKPSSAIFRVLKYYYL